MTILFGKKNNYGQTHLCNVAKNEMKLSKWIVNTFSKDNVSQLQLTENSEKIKQE